ncbi:hypothetical protein L9F63_024269, partial [Diploptera punctata]
IYDHRDDLVFINITKLFLYLRKYSFVNLPNWVVVAYKADLVAYCINDGTLSSSKMIMTLNSVFYKIISPSNPTGISPL